MSKVFFGSTLVREMKWQSTLPGKLDAILEKLDFASELDGKQVCVKMHLGANIGYTTIHPLFVRRLVSFIKNAGGSPFVTDVSWGADSAHERGYTQETIGCPIIPVAGTNEDFYYTYPALFKNLTEFKIAGEIHNADYLVCLSHAKGHGCSGYGGAIKNIAIGGIVGETRGAMHMTQHAEPYWDPEKCTHYSDGCTLCIDACTRNTMRFADDNTLHIGFHECNFCLDCNKACPTNALTVRDEIADNFQEALALAAQAVLKTFPGRSAVHINFATSITAYCDCMGYSTPSLVPDIGIFASKDIVAVEKATLDSIDHRNLIPGSMIESMPMRDVDGHLFRKVQGKDPYVQVYACERLGLGSTNYELEEIHHADG